MVAVSSAMRFIPITATGTLSRSHAGIRAHQPPAAATMGGSARACCRAPSLPRQRPHDDPSPRDLARNALLIKPPAFAESEVLAVSFDWAGTRRFPGPHRVRLRAEPLDHRSVHLPLYRGEYRRRLGMRGADAACGQQPANAGARDHGRCQARKANDVHLPLHGPSADRRR